MSDLANLFDTGALIDIYRGRQRIKPRFDQIINGAVTAYVSPISEAELWLGLRSGEQESHEALLALFIALPLTSEAGRLAGQWMQQFGAVGLGWMDALIAATATVAGIPMLTRDRRLANVLAGQAEFALYD
jgi:predicted nucleic acid-binding protein